MRVELVLESVDAGFLAPPIKRLARLLKAMLRGYGFRCVRAREIEEDQETAPPGHSMASCTGLRG